MASPEKLAPSLPETLPEDFFDWDSESSTAPSPVDSGEREVWEATLAQDRAPEPQRPFTDREAFLTSLLEQPRSVGSASSARVTVKPQKGFADWEKDAAPAARPSDRSTWEAWDAAHPGGKTPRPSGQSAERAAFQSPVVDRQRDARSAPSAPAAAPHGEFSGKSADESPSRVSRKLEPRQATKEASAAPGSANAGPVNEKHRLPESWAKKGRQADEPIFQMFSAKNAAVLATPNTSRKKWMIVAPVSAGSVLLLLLCTIPLFHHGAKAMSKPSIQPAPAATDTLPTTNTPKRPAKGQPTQDKPAATTEGRQSLDDQPASDENVEKPGEAQTEMMNGQLTAPTRIPKQVAVNEPPPASFGVAGSDGLGGSSGSASLFKGHTQAVVNVSKPVMVSSGVATGMLIRKTEPVYPTIAKSARVSGTVELHAVISKTGTIENLQVVSGPAMLRPAALEAVRTWRYKPYRLNNEPTEIETTINVIFSLGN